MEINNLSCSNDNKPILNMKLRWLINLAIIAASLLVFRGFVAEQLFNRAVSYYNFAIFKDAIREYKKVVLFDPGNKEALNWLGHSYLESGSIEKAIETYKRAIRLDTKDYFAYLDLGLIYYRQGQLEKARDVFYKVSLIRPLKSNTQESYLRDYKSSMHWLARVQIDLGEDNEVIQTYKKILDFDPDDKWAKDQLKKILSNRKR